MRLNFVNMILIVIAILVPGLMFSLSPNIQSSFNVRSSSSSFIEIDFNLPEWQLLTETKNNKTTHRVKLDNAPYLFVDEDETLPIISTTIAIPARGGVELNVQNQNMTYRDKVILSTHSQIVKEMANRGSNIYPQNLAQISEPTIVRDLRLITLNIYPIQYDKDAHRLMVTQSVKIRISFNNLPSINEYSGPMQISPSFDKIYRALVLNYDDVIQSRTTVTGDPVLLVIYGNFTDATYNAKIQEYIQLKMRRGYKVYSASTTTTGTTSSAIKNYIQNAYNTWQDRPDYVVLIGDVSGSIAIPTYYSSGTYGEGDYPYTFLAGSDQLGDVVIGRISVTSAIEFSTYIAKLVAMEANLSISDPAWLNKMLLVGDTASSGISTIYTNQYVHEVSEVVNPNYTYAELYQNSPSATTMNQHLSMGVSFFNYRGYLGMSGWSPPTSPINGSKLYHAVIITCGTGNFASTGTTESVVRSGTAAGLGGAVTAIGMATSSTHTPMNNCLNVGIFHGIFPAGMREMGSPMLLGKLYLHSIYGVSNTTQSVFFAQICNLIGDPTVPVYVGTPETIVLSYPTSIATGTTTIEVIARNANQQTINNAVITLVSGTTYQNIQRSDANGRVLFSIPNTLSGELLLMASKDDHKPTSNTITINSAGGLVYNGSVIDDDNSGNSSGNGNGIVNAGETIEFKFYLKNTSTGNASASGDLSCNDPYITMLSSRLGFNTITPGQAVLNNTAARFSVSPGCPDNYVAYFTASGGSTIGNWSVTIPVTIRSGALSYVNHSFIGTTNNVINPGNMSSMTINLQNTGLASLSSVYGILRSYDILFSITDSLAYYGNISAGANVSNSIDPFAVYARGQCINGMVIPLELYLYNDFGYSETKSFSITIGTTTINDPLGQDQYGYFIFDSGDVSYPQAPTYNWIGIAPAEGGSGTVLNITDPGASNDEGDQVGAVSYQTVNLPFPFKFYGRTYNQITVSANGFIAMGATSNSDWRNWRLPGPGGPNPMIAVFWDDLQKNTGSNIYVYYNSALHYYVVEWYNMISGYDRVTPETFQAILYDPVHYPTMTGDGQIKLQYKQFNNIDMGSGDSHPHGNYATIGIKDHNGTVGLEYTFNNVYPLAARPLTHESALFITTKPFLSFAPHLYVDQVIIHDNNGDGFLEPGETANLAIRIANMGMGDDSGINAVLSSSDPYVSLSGVSSQYGDITGLGYVYSNSFYGISIAPNCPDNYLISMQLSITSAGGSWVVPVSITIHKPALVLQSWSIDDSSANNNGRLDPGESANFVLNIQNESGIAARIVTVNLSETSPYLSLSSTTILIDSIPAGKIFQKRVTITATSSTPVGTIVPLGIAISSENGTPSTSSANIGIGVSDVLYDFEENNGSFTATSNTGTGWQWGTSTYSGAYSGTKVWGTILEGSYADNATYELVSPQIQIGSGSNLSFRHRYNIENNYDGGQVLISTNNGSTWTIITPIGGYPATNLPALGGPGYHGTLTTWTSVSFSLASYSNQSIRIKWLFKTDGSVVREGWFIDDVLFTNALGGISLGRLTGTMLINGSAGTDPNALVHAGDYVSTVNSNGTYSLSLAAGQYTVKATLPGYRSTSQNVSIVNNAVVSGINPNLQYLAPPQGISWYVSQNHLNLRWNALTNPAPSAYRVYEKIGTQIWQLVSTTNQATYNADLVPNTWYDYKVVALYDADESLPNRIVQINFVNPDADIQPGTPGGATIQRSGQNNTINWQPVTQDTLGNAINIWEYRIYASDTPDFVESSETFVGSTQNTTFTEQNVNAKRFYKIRALIGFSW